MKYKIYIFSVLALSLMVVSPVFAHTLKIDGSIGAVFHTDPDDYPIAGSPAKLFFDFKDKNNQLNLQNCNCSLTISSNNQILFNQNLTNPDIIVTPLNVTLSYTFPTPENYEVLIQGTPLANSTFQPFNLVYDISASEGSSTPITPQAPTTLQALFAGHLIHIIFFAAAIVICLVIIILDKRKNKK